MTEVAKHWEGQIVEGLFPLRKYLGGSDHSAVFLTVYEEGGAQKAVIKLVPADRATADLQLTNWRLAAQLTHPNLLHLYRTGRCRIDGNDLLYLVMEHAEEDLADVLRERALTADETRDMLNPVLDALEYLHGKGYVHGDLKPANILATGDQLKLSSDTISRADEAYQVPKKASVYDPPEAISGMKTTAGDVWALGTTLVEVLTQKVPEWQPGPNREPVVPESVPAPFADIARKCLRVEPPRRVSVADIAERLNARAAAASATAALAGVNLTPAVASAPPPVAAAPKPAPGPKATPVPPRPMPRAQPPVVRPETYGAPPKKLGYVVPLLVVAAVTFALVITIPRLFPRHAENSASTTGDSAVTPTATSSAKTAAPTESPKPKREEKAPSQTEARPAESAAKEQAARTTPSDAGAGTGALRPTSETTHTAAVTAVPAVVPATKPAPSRGGSPKGEVLDQVLPEISEKARETIHGRVRVGVRVHVDAAGAVTDAELDSPGPSQYFADQALKAAKRWAFTPPELDGKSVTSEWLLHFVFTSTDTKVTPAQTTP